MKDVIINSVDVTRLSNLRSQIKAYVTVTDLNGAPMEGLAKDHFAVIEDGVTLSAFDLQTAGEGLWIALVMDTTSSMHEDGLKTAKEAADRFVAGMGSADLVALYEFQEEPQLLVDFTFDHNKVCNAIAGLKLVDRWTCLYGAANAAVKKAMEIPQGRRAVVLLMDGKDGRAGKPCSTVTVDEMIALAWKQRVPVYVVGLGHAVDEATLKRIAEKTGGAYWSAPQPQDLADACRQVSKLLRNQYVVSYESTRSAGDHALVVRVDYQGHQGLNAVSFLIPMVPTPSGKVAKTPGAFGPSPPEEKSLVDNLRDRLPYLLLATAAVAAAPLLVVSRLRRRQPQFVAEAPPLEPIEREGVGRIEEETAYVQPVGEEPTTEVSAPSEFQLLATLVVLSSLQLPEGESYELYGRSVTIGRGADNDSVIPDQSVSRRHAELRYQDGEFYVYDKGSRFGMRCGQRSVLAENPSTARRANRGRQST